MTNKSVIGGIMAVAVRLRRTGATNNASFRVVAADKRSPRDGRFIENLGWYDPTKAGEKFGLKLDRIEHWKSNGAEISDTVRSLIKQAKNPGSPEKTKIKKQARDKAAVAAATPAPVEEAAPVKEAAPVEEVAAPVEETPAVEKPEAKAEEAPAEEAKAEDKPAEKAKAEDKPAEEAVADAPAEKTEK
jgi:small subunit ribosomal protein S16